MGLFTVLTVALTLTPVVHTYGPLFDRPWLAPESPIPSLNISYTTSGPVYDVLDWQVIQSLDPMFVNSHWAANWITTTSNLDLLVISFVEMRAGNDGTPNGGDYYGISLYELQSGWYGSNIGPAAGKLPSFLSNDTLDVQYGDKFRWYATDSDNFSSITSSSNDSGIIFNITFQPKGPILFDGGSGSFFWGTGYNQEWGAPSAYTTGSVTINGTQHQVDPARSTTWYDRQWGSGLATSGWYWFPVQLENGLRICVWAVEPVGKYHKTFATVLYPEGNTEIVTVEHDIGMAGAFVSQVTNITYYSSFLLRFPEKNAILQVTLPDVLNRHYGELPSTTSGYTLFEGWATYTGIWEGLPIRGWGLSEQKPFFV